jgi:Holliday junction DNA helicase RuvA
VIARLAGTLLDKHVQRLVIDVGGVGYDVHVPLSTFYAVGDPGAAVVLRIHTHVREDALQLFGFATALELALFDRLITVSGIGPKLALAVLSGIEPQELMSAVRQNDHADSWRRQEDRRADDHRPARSPARPGPAGGW